MNEKVFLATCKENNWQVEDLCGGVQDLYVLAKRSPAGEYFSIYLDKDNAVDDLKHQTKDFDVHRHTEMWLSSRGKNGCPKSSWDLLEDAIAIKAMLMELLCKIEGREKGERNG